MRVGKNKFKTPKQYFVLPMNVFSCDDNMTSSVLHMAYKFMAYRHSTFIVY